MTESDKPITEVSIKVNKEEYKNLVANLEELTKLMHELAQKDNKIKEINRGIEVKKRSRPPFRPAVFSLQTNYDREWTGYFNEAEKYIQDEKEQNTLEAQLAILKTERKEIEAKIRPLVPPNFYGVQIMAGNLRLTVNSESMIIQD